MKRTICVDVDGTLAPHPAPEVWDREDTFLNPFPGAKEFLERLSEEFNIIIYTCRCTEGLWGSTKRHLLANEVKRWLQKHNLPYDHVWTEPGKAVADVYLDDRAVHCDPESWKDQGVSNESGWNVIENLVRRRAGLRPVEDQFAGYKLNDERSIKRDG